MSSRKKDVNTRIQRVPSLLEVPGERASGSPHQLSWPNALMWVILGGPQEVLGASLSVFQLQRPPKHRASFSHLPSLTQVFALQTPAPTWGQRS